VPAAPRVLIVEDHVEIAELYQLKLQLDGYRVAVAADGVLGLKMARSLMPDMILLDVHLPHLDGLQMLSALREDGATSHLPVVVFSDDDSPSVVREAQRLNAAGYLVKAQLLPSRLSRTISELLQQHSEGAPARSEVQQAS
jgi:CheY-like chemotaxis protein